MVADLKVEKSGFRTGKRGIKSRLLVERGPPLKFFAVYIFAMLLIPSVLVSAQHTSNWPHPPEPADKSSTTSKTSSKAPGPRVDPVQLQREARELLELSQSLQPDIESVNHGLLPKDTIEKLKRIEKLSKHLRGELTP